MCDHACCLSHVSIRIAAATGSKLSAGVPLSPTRLAASGASWQLHCYTHQVLFFNGPLSPVYIKNTASPSICRL